MRRAKEIPIDATLDLHGCTAEEAKTLVREFLADERAHGSCLVRIIVGKGLRSPQGESVLGPAVRSVLVREQYSFVSAPWHEGGDGAIDVTIDI